jgi:AcrR family transcriptional regulator
VCNAGLCIGQVEWGDSVSEQRRSEDEPSVGRREAGKAERRRRILQAAREMIRETGDAGLSMRALAERAGVSPATPYNLFGSRRAIVLAAVSDVPEFLTRFRGRPPKDAVEPLFRAADLAVEFYVEDPFFYRTLWRAVFDATDDIRPEIYSAERDAFWRRLLDAADEAGVFEPSVDLELLWRALDRAFSSAMLEWVVGELPDAELAAAIRHGYALVLGGAASTAWRPALLDRLKDAQAALSEAKVTRT